ncbi:hypothetical protein So717_07480 [Roseobacter cerasinus]|uniref:Uncharacterized protein n=1 Tax=Roseobacter cerasinus TaxID=2602289 RepID=A0A640VQ50_9RHOB|nr:hypothetical protein [Roseobacter cerasinus]GFE48995.1 hypothetical protein So717_07480 [Roseobacter cerasinus]
MIRRVGRWLGRLLLVLALCLAGLLAPVAYTELACRGEAAPEPYDAILPPAHHRAESRTYLTYPEWHIVHAYDDYAQVISTDDPHTFGFLRSIAGFWSTLCDVTRVASAHGGVPGETKQMVYVIGVSFTAELLMKAAYEETLGRVIAMLRGPERAPLDDLSARQARRYATFLQQVPWYQWEFVADAEALETMATGALRDRERRFALGLEYGAKAAYARVIAAAVDTVGADELTLRMIITGYAGEGEDRLQIIAAREVGLEVETVRYRALTHLLRELAARGVNFIEIAGNDDIMLTVISETATFDGARSSIQRQGYGDYRHLVGLKVRDLGARLRQYQRDGIGVEHIHDY